MALKKNNTISNKEWLDFYVKNPQAFDRFITFVSEQNAAHISEVEELQQKVKTLQAQVKTLLDAVPFAKVETE